MNFTKNVIRLVQFPYKALSLEQSSEKILNNQICSDLYGPMITETMMCTSGSNGRGSCYGDSGG